MENQYTITFSIHRTGIIQVPTTKEKVRELCERYRKIAKLDDKFNPKNTETVIKKIEVLNNETGEIREYWNNLKNEIQF